MVGSQERNSPFALCLDFFTVRVLQSAAAILMYGAPCARVIYGGGWRQYVYSSICSHRRRRTCLATIWGRDDLFGCLFEIPSRRTTKRPQLNTGLSMNWPLCSNRPCLVHGPGRCPTRTIAESISPKNKIVYNGSSQLIRSSHQSRSIAIRSSEVPGGPAPQSLSTPCLRHSNESTPAVRSGGWGLWDDTNDGSSTK